MLEDVKQPIVDGGSDQQKGCSCYDIDDLPLNGIGQTQCVDGRTVDHDHAIGGQDQQSDEQQIVKVTPGAPCHHL